MSDLSQRVKDAAKNGMICSAVANAIATGVLVAIPGSRDFIRNNVQHYIMGLAVIDAMGTLFYVGAMIPNYHGNKTNNNNYAPTNSYT